MEEENTSGTIADGQQNLNDLQSYLVNFHKEIGVNGVGSVFQHSMSQIITCSSQPVFAAGTETTTPDDEQLPNIKEKKHSDTECNLNNDISMGEDTLDDQNSSTDMLYSVSQDTSSNDLDTHIVAVEGLIPGKIHLQEFTLEQLAAHCQQGTALSEGMVMLPLGDSNSILCQVSGPRLVQIVNVNGQPTLQLISTASVLPQANSVSDSPSVISGTSPVSVLTSFAADTNAIDPMPDKGDVQLVALQDTEGGSQPQLVSVPLDGKPDNKGDSATKNSSPFMCAPLLVMKNSGYQSVAILPSGDASQHEANYVLIVNPPGDKDGVAGTLYDFGVNISREVVEEVTNETGATKRLVMVKKYVKNFTDGEVMTASEQLVCSECSYSSPKKYLLARHMKSHCHDRPHKCSVCNHSFKTSSSLQNHVNTHMGVRPHKCKRCESAFTTSGELVRHIRYKHTFEKPHKCTECDYASVELSKLKRHMRSHTGERPYACSYCNYASPDTYKLKRHMRIHTGEKPYECEVCGTKFTQSNSLKSHRLIHSGNKPVFQCTLCPATCGRKTDLQIHIVKLHTSDQPIMCKKCNETFIDRYSFKVHMKSHEGEKCFKCARCEYATVSQRHLDMHLLTHSGLKPFECADCDLSFHQKQLLKQHRFRYHNTDHGVLDMNNKNVRCKECEKAFLKKGNLKVNLQMEKSAEDGMNNTESESGVGIHTCGGCPKSLVENLTSLTADELIEKSLLGDMKEGKLGTSPKVMVVHPDGHMEEVTAKLQSLSQSKHMDDFLVSLGVSGDSHFDQVAGLPVDVSVAEGNSLVSVTESGLTESIISESGEDMEDNRDEDADDGSQQTGSLVGGDMNIDHESVKSSAVYVDFPYIEIDRIGQHHPWKTKEKGTQANFDTDGKKKVKVLLQEEFSKLVHDHTGEETLDVHNIEVIDGDGKHVYLSVIEDREDGDSTGCDKRAADDSEENAFVKKIKVVICPSECP